MKSIKSLAEAYKAYGVNLRREFHMYPEASLKEYRTSDRIQEELQALGIPSEKIAGTGVVAYIHGAGSGKTIALRADMDALELQEENAFDYKSKNEGLMHACGHDGHTASLLTAAKILNDIKEDFNGCVKLMFQPGEETARGAKKLIEAGVLEDVDAVFGIHIWNDLEVGKVSIESGPRMASAGIFKVYIEGKGGHGSMPNQGIDSVVVGAAIVMNLQSVVAREINPLEPAVITCGIFDAGTRGNILAGEAYLEGTTRCFSLEVDGMFETTIRRIVENTARSYRAKARLDYEKLVLPTINPVEMSKIGEVAVKALLGEEGLSLYEKTTGGEDFSFYMVEKPSAFAFVGARKPSDIETYPHHHPKFDIDEVSIEVSSALYAQYAIEYLKSEGDVI